MFLCRSSGCTATRLGIDELICFAGRGDITIWMYSGCVVRDGVAGEAYLLLAREERERGSGINASL